MMKHQKKDPSNPSLYSLGKKYLNFLFALGLTLIFTINSPWVHAQAVNPDTKTSGDQNTEEIKPAPVMLNDRVLFEIKTPVASFTTEDRARLSGQRIQQVADDENLSVNDIQIKNPPNSDHSTISVNKKVLVTITEADAQAAGLTREELGHEYLEIIRGNISLYRRERQPFYRAVSTLLAILATISIWLVFKAINYLFPLTKNWTRQAVNNIINTRRIPQAQLIASEISNFLIQILRLVRLIAFGAIVYLYIPLVFSFFPITRSLGNRLFGYLQSATLLVVNGIIDYVPNIFIIVLICFVTYYLIDFIKPIFEAIGRNRLSFPGFYSEWAQPTYDLLKFLIIAIAFAITLPYIPGFQSPAFQGVSVFLGVLFSLGSTSAVANTVGGIILIYTRAFQIGDRIRVGEVVGDVEEKSLLVTRLRTPKNILITIPNSTLLGVNIINYSASARDTHIPLILNTTITLGYDIPWRKVHKALVDAALKTNQILREPPPFVLQTALNDFYISYEINAYTNATKKLEPIYSELHQNILDCCNEAGIEILSPHYSALRDGNQNTIPADYLPKDYTAPGFRLEHKPGQEE